jgi:hypothetical protein
LASDREQPTGTGSRRLRGLLRGYEDPVAIGQLVDVHTTLTQVAVRRAGHTLATRDGCWATRQMLTDPTHVETAAVLRRQFQQGRPPVLEHPVRDLTDYDRAFGVDFTAGTEADGEVA